MDGEGHENRLSARSDRPVLTRHAKNPRPGRMLRLAERAGRAYLAFPRTCRSQAEWISRMESQTS